MNKLAAASLAAVASAHQLFLEPVDVVSQPSDAQPELFANGSTQKIIGYYTDWSVYGRNY